MILRDYQQQCVDRLRASYAAGHRSVLLSLPTGGGKTVIFSHVVRSAVERGNRCLVVVHRRELLAQASRTIGVPHGLIAPGHPWQPRALVQIASVQALRARQRLLAASNWSPRLVVLDEAHHAVAGTWRALCDAWPAARVLGVTATPIRQDGRGLGEVFQDLVQGPQIGELIRRGYLAPPVVYAPPSGVDLTGVRRRAGDYARDQAAAAVDRPDVTGCAVEWYRRLVPGEPAIAFCASVGHAERVAADLRAAGWRAVAVSGSTPAAERDAAIAGLATGAVQIVASCDVVSEGTDVPAVRAAILLRPTQSEGLYLQQVGRVLRTAPGKSDAVVIDHVGNVHRHGLPDEDRTWTLDGRVQRPAGDRDTGPTVSICPECYRGVVGRTCAGCGWTAPVQDRSDRLVVDTSGELAIVDAAERDRIRRARAAEQAAASTYEELVELALRRGYSPGWARRVHEARKLKGGGRLRG